MFAFFARIIPKTHLRVALYALIFGSWAVILLLSSSITIANSHIVSTTKAKVEETTKIFAPSKLGQDTSRAVAGAKISTPPVLTGLAKTEGDQVQNVINNFSSSQPTKFGIYFKDLKNNAIAGINEDTVFVSASLYKLYVAELIFHQIDLGNIKTSAPADGTGYTIQDCLNQMITVSNNDCGIALGNMVQWSASNATIADRGYINSNLNNPPQTTAGDTGKLLEYLYQQLDEVSNPEQLVFMELLKQQQLNNRLPAGLPTGTIIAHKTGDIDSDVHDVGIVFGPKTNYIISVLSGPWPSPSAAPDAFANLSSQIYKAVEQ